MPQYGSPQNPLFAFSHLKRYTFNARYVYNYNIRYSLFPFSFSSATTRTSRHAQAKRKLDEREERGTILTVNVKRAYIFKKDMYRSVARLRLCAKRYDSLNARLADSSHRGRFLRETPASLGNGFATTGACEFISYSLRRRVSSASPRRAGFPRNGVDGKSRRAGPELAGPQPILS